MRNFSSACAATADGGVSCTGVSSLSFTRARARTEAIHAALDQLGMYAANHVSDPRWKRIVPHQYRRARARGLRRWQQTFGRARCAAAKRAIDASRAAATAILRRTAPGLIVRVTDEQVVRLRNRRSGVRRYVAYVRYAFSRAKVQWLLKRYRRVSGPDGVQVATVVPPLAWRYSSLRRGAVILSLGSGPLRRARIAIGAIVTELQERVVDSGQAFARLLTEQLEILHARGGVLTLQVRTANRRGAMRYTAMVARNPNAHGPGRKPHRGTPIPWRVRGKRDDPTK